MQQDTGLCECFHGYGGHNCHRFEIDILSQIEPMLLKEYHKFRKFEDENYVIPKNIITEEELIDLDSYIGA